MIIFTSENNPSNWEMIDGIELDIRNGYIDVSFSDPNSIPSLVAKFGITPGTMKRLLGTFNVLIKLPGTAYHIQSTTVEVGKTKIRMLMTNTAKFKHLNRAEAFELLPEEQKEKIIWTMDKWFEKQGIV